MLLAHLLCIWRLVDLSERLGAPLERLGVERRSSGFFFAGIIAQCSSTDTCARCSSRQAQVPSPKSKCPQHSKQQARNVYVLSASLLAFGHTFEAHDQWSRDQLKLLGHVISASACCIQLPACPPVKARLKAQSIPSKLDATTRTCLHLSWDRRHHSRVCCLHLPLPAKCRPPSALSVLRHSAQNGVVHAQPA